MKKTAHFVMWIGFKFIPLDSKHLTGFTREEIDEIIHLYHFLNHSEKHLNHRPSYRWSQMVKVWCSALIGSPLGLNSWPTYSSYPVAAIALQMPA